MGEKQSAKLCEQLSENKREHFNLLSANLQIIYAYTL